MSKFIKRVIFLAVITSWVHASDPQSAHIASPNQYSLLLENESVMVLKMVLKPGEADVLHRHRNETVYFEKGGKLKITEKGKPVEIEVPDGHVMWHEAWTHQVTNIGNNEVVAIVIEEKRLEK